MTAARIKQLVADHFAEFLPELARFEDLDPSTHLVNDLAANSLDVIKLVFSVEQEYGIYIPILKVAQIKTVQQMIEAVNEQIEVTENLEVSGLEKQPAGLASTGRARP